MIDKLIEQTNSDKKLTTQLEEVKNNIKKSPKDEKTKNKISQFFTKLGDDNSELHKKIKGIGIAKKAIIELAKLGEKLKDLIF